MKKQLIISVVALTAMATVLVGHSGNNNRPTPIKNILHKAINAQPTTFNPAAALIRSGAIGAQYGGLAIGSKTIGGIRGSAPVVALAVGNLESALGLPVDTLNSFTVSDVKVVAQTVADGGNVVANVGGGLTLIGADGVQSTIQPAASAPAPSAPSPSASFGGITA